jgi:hypothetical protein
MSTSAKILRAIAHAAEFSAGGATPEERAHDFISALAGTLDACGPDAAAIAERVFALGRVDAAKPASGT